MPLNQFSAAKYKSDTTRKVSFSMWGSTEDRFRQDSAKRLQIYDLEPATCGSKKGCKIACGGLARILCREYGGSHM